MSATPVTTLPELKQADFPALPEIPVGKTLLCFGTAWQNAEKEYAAGCLISICIEAKQWQPVTSIDFADRLRKHPMVFPSLARGVANALWGLVDDGFVEVVKYQGANCFVPTPRLAAVALADPRQLRVA